MRLLVLAALSLSALVSVYIVCWWRLFETQKNCVVFKAKPELPSLPSSTLPETQQRFCRKPYIEVKDDVYKAVLYQCGGEDYYEFHDSLQSLWSESITERPFWGRRESPAPRNTNILVWGNSHTRQVLEAMLCQYEDKIIDGYLEEEEEEEDDDGDFLGWVQLEHNVTIVWVINTWHSFTGDRWRHVLETSVLQSMTKVPASNGDHITKLADFDVLLLGKFNRMSNDVDTKTSFYRSMYKELKEHPKLIDFEAITPGLSQLSSAFNGAVVGLTAFAPDAGSAHRMQTEAAQSNRANVMVLEGRHYMDVLGECVGMLNKGVGPCVNQTVGHRCAGAYGGHADVMVWDIVETLHQLL